MTLAQRFAVGCLSAVIVGTIVGISGLNRIHGDLERARDLASRSAQALEDHGGAPPVIYGSFERIEELAAGAGHEMWRLTLVLCVASGGAGFVATFFALNGVRPRVEA